MTPLLNHVGCYLESKAEHHTCMLLSLLKSGSVRCTVAVFVHTLPGTKVRRRQAEMTASSRLELANNCSTWVWLSKVERGRGEPQAVYTVICCRKADFAVVFAAVLDELVLTGQSLEPAGSAQ